MLKDASRRYHEIEQAEFNGRQIHFPAKDCHLMGLFVPSPLLSGGNRGTGIVELSEGNLIEVLSSILATQEQQDTTIKLYGIEATMLI
jgi:hypothetical protein